MFGTKETPRNVWNYFFFSFSLVTPCRRKSAKSRRVLNDFPEESKIFARLTREAAFFLEAKWTWHENLQELICGSFIEFFVEFWLIGFLEVRVFFVLFFFLWKGRLEVSIFWEFSGETFSRPSFPVTLFDT